jgi:hypothetical protein
MPISSAAQGVILICTLFKFFLSSPLFSLSPKLGVGDPILWADVPRFLGRVFPNFGMPCRTAFVCVFQDTFARALKLTQSQSATLARFVSARLSPCLVFPGSVLGNSSVFQFNVVITSVPSEGFRTIINFVCVGFTENADDIRFSHACLKPRKLPVHLAPDRHQEGNRNQCSPHSFAIYQNPATDCNPALQLITLAYLWVLALGLAILKRSVWLLEMALALVGTRWRGEAWKTVFRVTEDQLTQRLQQSPKTISFCPDQNWPCDAGLIASRFFDGLFQPLRWRFELQPLASAAVHQQQVPPAAERLQSNDDACPMLRRTSLEPFLERSLCMPGQSSPNQPQRGITADLTCENHNQNRATPIDFYVTYSKLHFAVAVKSVHLLEDVWPNSRLEIDSIRYPRGCQFGSNAGSKYDYEQCSYSRFLSEGGG